MPTFQPAGNVTGPDAPDATDVAPIDTSSIPEKPSTPPAGVSADPRPAPEEAPPDADAPADLLAGKFKSQDDLVKAYKELEAKLGQPKADTEADTEVTEEAPQVPEGALDLTPFVSEYQRDGKLSDASYDHLSKLGLGRDTVDTYIAGREATNKQFVSEVTAPVGGPEGYATMLEWAATNLSAPDIVAFNQAVMSKDRGIVEMAIRDLAGRYQAAEGKAPNLLAGGGVGRPGGYESVDQMKSDMNDPRYIRGDTAFHAMVDRKLRATTAF